MTDIQLNKGVHVHTFFDQSGCVFFNEITGETIGFRLSFEEIYQKLSSEDSTNQNSELSTLFSKGFVI